MNIDKEADVEIKIYVPAWVKYKLELLPLGYTLSWWYSWMQYVVWRYGMSSITKYYFTFLTSSSSVFIIFLWHSF